MMMLALDAWMMPGFVYELHLILKRRRYFAQDLELFRRIHLSQWVQRSRLVPVPVPVPI
jgi:hypothetical protein